MMASSYMPTTDLDISRGWRRQISWLLQDKESPFHTKAYLRRERKLGHERWLDRYQLSHGRSLQQCVRLYRTVGRKDRNPTSEDLQRWRLSAPEQQLVFLQRPLLSVQRLISE